MLSITSDASYVTVINESKVTDAKDCPELVQAWTEVLPLFARRKGYIGAAIHTSQNKEDKLVTVYLQWETVKDHEDCEKSREWPLHAAAARFVRLFFIDKRATCIARVVKVVGVVQPSKDERQLTLSEQMANQGHKLDKLIETFGKMEAAIGRRVILSTEGSKP